MAEKKPKPRGLAALSPEKRREIAALGGKAVQKSGKGYKWTREQAVEAGRKGGRKSQGGGNQFNTRTGRAAQRKRKRQGS